MNKVYVVVYVFLTILLSNFVSAENSSCSDDTGDYLVYDNFNDNNLNKSIWINTTAVSTMTTIEENNQLTFTAGASAWDGLWVNLTKGQNITNGTTFEFDFSYDSNNPIFLAGLVAGSADKGGVVGGSSTTDSPVIHFYFPGSDNFPEIRNGVVEVDIPGEALTSGTTYHVKFIRHENWSVQIYLYNEDLTELLGIGNVTSPGDFIKEPLQLAFVPFTSAQSFTIDNVIAYNSTNNSACPLQQNFTLYNCTNTIGDYPGMETLNITFWQSENNSRLKDVITGNVYFDGGINNPAWNFSTKLENRNNYSICLYPNSSIQTADVLIDYTWGGKNYNYIFDDTIFDNVSRMLKLFVSDSTSLITFTVIDESTDPIENAIIKVQQYDIGDNSYKEVEVLETNSQGQALANLVLNTVWYRFIVEVDGEVLLTDGPTKITATTRTFQVSLLTDFFDRYEIIRGVTVIQCNYTNITDNWNFNFQWNDPNSEISHGCLKVVNQSAIGSNTVGDVCTAGSSGTQLVSIGNPSNYSTSFLGSCYVKFSDGETHIVDTWTETFRQQFKSFGLAGLWWASVLIITMFMVGLYSAPASIILGLVGFVFMNALGFITFSWGWTASIVILGILAAFIAGKVR